MTRRLASAAPRRLAVLPFANISADAADEYFSDGMSEELISQLSRIGEIRAIARTSIMRYKGANHDIAEIGRALQVGTILEGSVRKAGNRVRIATQLIDVASQVHLWSEDYDRALEDVFAIQSDIAKQVAAALQSNLLADERAQDIVFASAGRRRIEALRREYALHEELRPDGPRGQAGAPGLPGREPRACGQDARLLPVVDPGPLGGRAAGHGERAGPA